jgi:hypothetical protein
MKFTFLAAELQEVSNSLVVNTEFCTTFVGRRMEPYFKQERGQEQRASLNEKWHPSRLVGSVSKRSTFFCNRAYRITVVVLDWQVNQLDVHQHGRTWRGPTAVVCGVTAHWIHCARPILYWECLPPIVKTVKNNLYVAVFYTDSCFYEKSTFILYLYRNDYISGLVHNVGVVTFITVRVLNNLLAPKRPPMVSESAVYVELILW